MIKYNMLNESDISLVMRDFPNIKLSYENLVHKKVYDSDIMIAIPEGKKHFAWFSVYKQQNVCFLLEITADKQLESVKIVNACFSSELSYGIGTIFYGTLFLHNNTQIFSLEDIYYYKGKTAPTTMKNKLEIYLYIFNSDIKQVAYNSNFVVFGLPLMCKNFSELLKKIELLPYNISHIQYRYTSKNNILNVKYVKPNKNNCNSTGYEKKELVFKVKAELQNDIYNLYAYSKNINSQDYFYDFAYIPDYKTSVMMNRLFRKIKENEKLDALEESDCEEEFQDERIDKFVFLEKSYYMVCTYNNKFKKWVPLRLAKRDDKQVEISLLT